MTFQKIKFEISKETFRSKVSLVLEDCLELKRYICILEKIIQKLNKYFKFVLEYIPSYCGCWFEPVCRFLPIFLYGFHGFFKFWVYKPNQIAYQVAVETAGLVQV